MQIKKSEQGFSLVELAIVMVIIGLIVAAVTVGKGTMRSAETLKAYQKVVVPCVATVGEAVRNGSVKASDPGVPTDYSLQGGSALECNFLKKNGVVQAVTIKNAPQDLQDLMKKQLHNGADVSVTGDTISLYVPGAGLETVKANFAAE